MFSSSFKMAARDFVMRLNSTQLWDEWAKRRGINTDDIDTKDDTDEDTEDTITINEQRESHAIKLRKQDMKIFGCCPSNDDIFLILCEECNPKQVIKPQCLKDHFEIRHPGFQIKCWKGKSETTTQYSKASVTGAAPSQNSRTSTPKYHGKSAASKNNNNHSSATVLSSHSPSSTSRSERPKSVPKSKRNIELDPVIGTGLVSQNLAQTAHSPLNTLPVNKELPSPQKPPPEVLVGTSVICSTEEQNTFSDSPISVQFTVSVPQNATSTNSEDNIFSREDVYSKKSTLSNKSKKIQNERKPLPLRDRVYDPNVHCGVVMSSNGRHCTSGVTCKKHSISLRRAVLGRTKDFNDLLSDHRAAMLKPAKTKLSPFNKEIDSIAVLPTEHMIVDSVSNVQSPSTDTTSITMIPMTKTTSSTTVTNNLISLGSPNVDIIGATIQPKLLGVTVPYFEAGMPRDYEQISIRNQYREIPVSLNMDFVTSDSQDLLQPFIAIKQERVQPVVKREMSQPVVKQETPQPVTEILQEKLRPTVNVKVDKPVEAECIYIRGRTPDPAYITHSPLPYTVSMFGLKRLNNGPIIAHCKYANCREAFRIATSANKSDNFQPVAKVPVISRLSSLTVKQESEQQLDVKYSEPAIILPLRQTTASELNVSMNKDNTLTSDTLPSILCATITARDTQSISEVSVPTSQPQPKISKSKEKNSSKRSLNGPPTKRKRASAHMVPNGTNISQTATLSAFPYYVSDVPPAPMKQQISLSSAFPHAFIENSAVLARHSVVEQNCLPMPLEIIPNSISQFSSTAHLAAAQSNDYLTLAALNGQVSMQGNIIHSLTVNKVMPPVGTGLGITLGEAGLVHPLSHLPSKCSSPKDLRISTSSNKSSHMIKSILSNSSVSPNSSASSGLMWSRTKTKSIKSRKTSKTSAMTNSVIQNTCDVTSLSNLLQANSSNVTNPNAVNNSLSPNTCDVGHFLNVFQANSSSATHPSLLHRLPSSLASSSLLHSGSSSPSVHVSPLHNGLGPSPPPYYNHPISITSLSPVSPTSTNSRGTESSDGSTGNGQKVWQQTSGELNHHRHQQAVYNNFQRNNRQKK